MNEWVNKGNCLYTVRYLKVSKKTTASVQVIPKRISVRKFNPFREGFFMAWYLVKLKDNFSFTYYVLTG
jgi:hypothetical protein